MLQEFNIRKYLLLEQWKGLSMARKKLKNFRIVKNQKMD
jgi:hypothetical protein